MKDPKQLLQAIVKAADEKHADDIVALDLAEVSLLADYFVILSGATDRQLQAIVDNVEDAAAVAGYPDVRIEGKKGSQWLLMDFGDVVVHAFLPEAREFYNLEKLWAQAPLVDVSAWVDAE